MQLKNSFKLSTVTAIAIVASNALYAENYVAVEYLQYDENNDRVSVSAPSVSASYDIGTDFNIKADFVSDAVSGATPSWQPDSGSGASSRDNSGDYVYENQEFDETRNAGSLMLTTRFDNRDELYTGIDYSRESDFDSKAVSAEYLHYTDKSHNQSINIGASYAFNEILAYEYDGGSGASQKEEATSINVQVGISQILNDHAVVKAEVFAILDDGYLTNPHANVVRDYSTANQRLLTEKRPDKRAAYGLSLKHITMLGEDLSLKNNYRFYTDDWDVTSHTLQSDVYYTLNKKLTLGAGLRYYTQSESNFYNKNKDFFTNEAYASSDERLSQFDALTYKASIDFKYNDNISYNLGGQFYSQSTGLDATMITTGLKYKF
jgi:outer membrane receptor protein involved in Fe transport